MSIAVPIAMTVAVAVAIAVTVATEGLRYRSGDRLHIDVTRRFAVSAVVSVCAIVHGASRRSLYLLERRRHSLLCRRRSYPLDLRAVDAINQFAASRFGLPLKICFQRPGRYSRTTKQSGKVSPHAMNQQLSQHMLQLCDAMLAVAIARHGHMLTVFQNCGDESGQHLPGTHFDKYACSVVMHALHFADEVDRLYQVLSQGRRKLAFVRASGRVGVDRQLRFTELDLLKGGFQFGAGSLHEWAVESSRNCDWLVRHTLAGERFARIFDISMRTGNDCLVGSVDVGDHHAGMRLQRCLHFIGWRGDGSHGAGLATHRTSQEPSAQLRDIKQILLRDGTGRVEGDVLAVAVSRHHIRCDAECSKQVEHSQVGRTNSRLGHVCIGERGLLLLAFFVAESRCRIDVIAQRCRIAFSQLLVGSGERVADLREVEGELPQHVDALRTLSREKESNLAGWRQWFLHKENAARVIYKCNAFI